MKGIGSPHHIKGHEMFAAPRAKSAPSPIREARIDGDKVFIVEAFGIKYRFVSKEDAADFASIPVLQRMSADPEHLVAKDVCDLEIVDQTVDGIRRFGTRYHFRQVERFAKRLRGVEVDEGIV